MQSHPNHLDLQVVKTMLESMHYEVGELRGPRGDQWLSIRICEGAVPVEPPDRYTAYIRAGEDNYLSIHVNLGNVKLDQPSGAWVFGQVPEINYRNDVAFSLTSGPRRRSSLATSRLWSSTLAAWRS